MHTLAVAVATLAAASTLAVGAGPGGAATAPPAAGTPTGWVVENPRADGMWETYEGHATVRTADGATISCPLVEGWGWAESATLPSSNHWFGEVGVTSYEDCTGPAPEGLAVVSSPGTMLTPGSYDATADRVGGSAHPHMWGLFLETPDCGVTLYPQDPLAEAPLAYDNATATLALGPIDVVVTGAEGTGCAGLPEVGDELTFETTVVATPGFTVRPA